MKIKPFSEKKAQASNVVHDNTLLNRVYQNRGVATKDDLDYQLTKLIPPSMMKGMDEGTDILINHILADSKILIIGDYDCDGATSTTIAVEGLKILGAKNVDFLIPDRQIHGYGLSPAIVEIAGQSKPDLIVTVDNGIAAFDGANAVKNLEHPCQLLITDHHLTAESGEIPHADAVINPQQPGCNFPSKNIAGCGVMFYTILGLRKKMRDQDLFSKMGMKEPALNSLLDVVALGTVADVVKLDLNNRIIVNAGLTWINQGMCRPGLKKLLELSKKEIGKIVAQDFGFGAGPRINAAGRLDDMTIGIRCLLEKNEVIAEGYAEKLDELNKARKEIEGDMLEDALGFLDHFDPKDDGVVLYDPTWHEGVIGILASRVKDRTDKPTICFSDTHELADAKNALKRAKELGISGSDLTQLQEEVGRQDIKGSARSIPGIHLKHVLDEINKKRPDILSKFGGHAAAAGLSIKSSKLQEFQRIFSDIISREMTNEMRIGAVAVDIEDLDPEHITLENAEMIEAQGIWGQGFESPVFSGKFDIVSKRPLQDKHLKLVVKPKGSDEEFDAISFNCIDRGVHPVEGYMEASFQLSVNEWRGRRTVQLMIGHLQDPELAASMELAEKEKDAPIEIMGAAKMSLEDDSNPGMPF